MKELSIFVDESGDFGDYAEHSSYYIISMILHDQSIDITKDVDRLESKLADLGYPNHCMHSGPIIRNEQEYRKDTLDNRRKLLKAIMVFFRHLEISCKTIAIEKKHIVDPLEAVSKLSKLLARFIKDNYEFFIDYDVVKVYYDNGQVEITKLLSSVFNALLVNVEFRRVYPSDYRLFQVADLVCSLKLLKLKMESHELAKNELLFFEQERVLNRKYLKVLEDKEKLS